MNQFSDDMAKRGHEYAFQLETTNTGVRPNGTLPPPAKTAPSFDVGTFLKGGQNGVAQEEDVDTVRKEDDLEALAEILQAHELLPMSQKSGIDGWLLGIYETSRGFEMGTFDPLILSTTFKKQTSRWNALAFGCVSDVIVMAHRFVTTTLESICGDRQVREGLTGLLIEGLETRYRKAVEHAEFLLSVERDGTPMTMNHYFNDNLEKR